MNTKSFRWIALTFASLAALALAACASPPPRPAQAAQSKSSAKPAADDPIANEMLKAHNRERTKAGLPPLALNPKLQAAALAHARDMAEHQKMDHKGSDGSTPSERLERFDYHGRGSGENVAYGQKDVAEVMDVWMKSPHHKENILGKYDEMGSAIAKDEDGVPYWCVDFGRSWPKVDVKADATKLVEALNRERTEAEMKALRTREKLDSVAQGIVDEMAAAHGKKKEGEDAKRIDPAARLEKAGYEYSRVGESVAIGQATPAEALKTWMSSPQHKKNLLGEEFTEVGAACAIAKDGTPYWGLILATPRKP